MTALLTAIAVPDSVCDAEFNALRNLLYRETGVSLSDAKRALVSSRLARRLRQLNLRTFGEYVGYLRDRDPSGAELQTLVNCLTTNKTDFLREPHHFGFLREVVVPDARRRAAQGEPRRLRIWSAACSQGDEPYSIAMALLESLPSAEAWDVKILASDVNTDVLATAQAGEYPPEKLAPLPDAWRNKYFIRRGGAPGHTYRVRPEVQSLIAFRRINLMEPWPHQATFDAIFCRNVLIYFDQTTQERLVQRLGGRLREHGLLMLGHSESSPWLAELFDPLGKTVYRRRPAKPGPSRLLTAAQERPRSSTAAAGASTHTPALPLNRIAGAPAIGPPRNILAGQTCVLAEPGEITTILGSCVAVCLYDPQSGVGGMNHFMLPAQPVDAGASARYGVHAMELLITGIMKRGGERGRLQAKAFGGANLLQLQLTHDSCQIGRQNVAFVKKFLADEQIPLVAEKLGGGQPLRIRFQPQTGRVLVKTLSRAADLVSRERIYRSKSAKAATAGGEFTLFTNPGLGNSCP
ncbi:MAG: hypothetical protein CMJ58_09845 [Planctomycetaceae bacterium]|nr:hypothetical protein [Planctomycetaceae bacterium]